MPTSFIDLESGKGLCCCPGGYCCFSPFIPSAGQGMLGRGCASSKGRARLKIPGTGVGLACPSLPPSGEYSVGQVAMAPCAEALCRADRRGAHLTSAMAKSPTFSILNYN